MPPSRKQQASGPTSAKPAKNTSKKQKAKDDDRPNIAKVVLGEQVMVPLYKSPYPVDLVGEKPEMLYVCEFCFKYTTDISKYLGHRVGYFLLPQSLVAFLIHFFSFIIYFFEPKFLERVADKFVVFCRNSVRLGAG